MNTLRNITNPERFTVTKSLKNEIEIAKKREQLIEYMKEKEELNKFQKDKTAEMNERNLAPLTKLLSRETTNDKGEKKVISLMDGFDELKKNITDLSSIQFVTDNTGNKWSVAELLASKNPEIDLNNFSPEKRVIIDDTRNSIKEREDLLNKLLESQVIYDDGGVAIPQAQILDVINGKLTKGNMINKDVLAAIKELSPKESIREIADSVSKLVGMEVLRSETNKDFLENIKNNKGKILSEIDNSKVPIYVTKGKISVSFPFTKDTYIASELLLLKEKISDEDYEKMMALNSRSNAGAMTGERLKAIDNLRRLAKPDLLVEAEIANNSKNYYDKKDKDSERLYKKMIEKIDDIKSETGDISKTVNDTSTALGDFFDRDFRRESALEYAKKGKIAETSPTIIMDDPQPKGAVTSEVSSPPSILAINNVLSKLETIERNEKEKKELQGLIETIGKTGELTPDIIRRISNQTISLVKRALIDAKSGTEEKINIIKASKIYPEMQVELKREIAMHKKISEEIDKINKEKPSEDLENKEKPSEDLENKEKPSEDLENKEGPSKEPFVYAGTSLEDKNLIAVTPIDDGSSVPKNTTEKKGESDFSWLWKGSKLYPPLLEEGKQYLSFKDRKNVAINKEELDKQKKLIVYKKEKAAPNIKNFGEISDNVKDFGEISDNVKEFIFGKDPTQNFIYKNFGEYSHLIDELRGDIKNSIFNKKIKKDDLEQISGFYSYVGFIQPKKKTVNSDNKMDQIRIIQDILKDKIGIGLTNYKKYSKFYKDAPPKHGYKIGSDGSFGDLIIDVKSLLGFQKLIAYTKDGEKVINQKVNKDFIDLVTKRRFNKNSYYSPETEDLFYKLVSLAGMPIHESSEKYKKILNKKNNNNIVRIVSNPNDLVKRMNVLTGQILAGNSSLQVKNELSEVIDMLLKLDIITKEQHGILFNNFLN